MPLALQIADGLRSSILNGLLLRGSKLPPSRLLASDLNVSRSTVVEAYEHLHAEGFISSKVGSGTTVIETKVQLVGGDITDSISYDERLVLNTPPDPFHGFNTGTPSLEELPKNEWKRLFNQVHSTAPSASYGYGPVGGLGSLKIAIARHVRLYRGILCHPDQIIITERTRQIASVLGVLLKDDPRPVYVENPGHQGIQAALSMHGHSISPILVDECGITTSSLAEDDAKMLVVTPSHQYPTGTMLTLERRLEILEWAHNSTAYIFEDDYDGEFRYNGHPLTALYGLDRNGRVVYAGTFAKSLFPDLGLAFAILPPELVKQFINVYGVLYGPVSMLKQMTLERFIKEGYFSSHLRKMHDIYRQRMDCLTVQIRRKLGNYLRAQPIAAGLHVCAYATVPMDDKKISLAANMANCPVDALSNYCFGEDLVHGLIFGFGGAPVTDIPGLVDQLRIIVPRYVDK